MRSFSTVTRTTLVLVGLALLSPGVGRTERKPAAIDPLVRRMIRASETARALHGRADAVDPDEMKFFARVVAANPDAQPPNVRVRLKLDAEARRTLESSGIPVYGRMAGFASAVVPIDRLQEVADLAGVEQMQAVRIPKTELDVSRPLVGSTAVNSTYGSAGAGVIYAAIDTGIDWHNPDFRNANGTTRIKFIWSQDDTCVGTPPPAPFAYGCLYTEAQINAALTGGPTITAPDADGHGTHTTGVGAGNGLNTGHGFPAGRYVGMAPQADIIMVKTFPEPGRTTNCTTCFQLSDGLDFIDMEAAALGKPYVVNMSIGSQLGGHDGTDLDEQTIDALVGPGIRGKAVIKSAGNDRGHNIHISGNLTTGATFNHLFTIPSYTPIAGTLNDAIALEIWYHGSDHLTVTLLDPTTSPCGSTQLTLSSSTGGGGVSNATTSGRMVIDDTSSPGPNGDRFFDVEVDDFPSAAPCRGTWTFRVHGDTIDPSSDGRYDAWIWFTSFGSTQAEALWNVADNARVLSIPGTSFNVMAAGGMVSKDAWTSSLDGLMYHYTGVGTVGGLATFSSPGPTRDGRRKPEITAPSTAIVSSLSQDAAPTVDPHEIVEDGVHWALPGTSFASPHVAGVIAQILAINPTLDAIQLRQLIELTAIVDANTTSTIPNDNWGFGKLNAIAATNLLQQEGPLSFGDSVASFTFTGVAGATAYNVYRGNLSAKSATNYGTCFLSHLAVPQFTDPSAPTLGDGFFYYLTAIVGGVEGSLGKRSDGSTRPNTTPCP